MKSCLSHCLPTAAAALLAGCAMLPGSGERAVADLRPTAGNSTSGKVEFVQRDGRVLVRGEVRGLRPEAEHGFHVHEKGDCSSPDAMSAGGHFNPGAQPHGRHGGGSHHAGDLPSLRADKDGVARFRIETTALSVGQGAADVIGKGLIVHKDPDDYTTQPTGNAGARLACAVIGR